MNIRIETNNRTDFNAICKAIVGDSKSTMSADNNFHFLGTMTDNDYEDMMEVLKHRVPVEYIYVDSDYVATLIKWEFSDELDADGDQIEQVVVQRRVK